MPSEVWKSFKKSGGKTVCICGEELTLLKSGSTTHFSGHLKSARHKEAMGKKKVGPSAPKKVKLESVATLFSPNFFKQQSQQLTSDITDFIVDNNLHFSIAESRLLRRLITRNYGQAMLPSRHDVSAEIPVKATNYIEDLRSFVQGQHISLTLDEFSDKEHSLLCITGSYLSSAFVFCSKVLAFETFFEMHTGDNIAAKINLILNVLEVDKNNVWAAIRHGALNLAGSKGGGCVKAGTQDGTLR